MDLSLRQSLGGVGGRKTRFGPQKLAGWKLAVDLSIPNACAVDGSGLVATMFGIAYGGAAITNMQQATAARKPHFGATDFNAAKPGVTFGGTDDCMQRTVDGQVYLSGAGTVYTLTRGIPGVSAVIYSESSQTVANVQYIPICGHATVNTSLAALVRDASGIALADTVELATNVFSTSPVLIGMVDSGTTLMPRVNGAAGSPQAYTRPGAMGTLDRMGLGALFNGGSTPSKAATFELAMIFTFGRAMTVPECQRFEGWVQHHPVYGSQVTLPTTHPYRYRAP